MHTDCPNELSQLQPRSTCVWPAASVPAGRTSSAAHTTGGPASPPGISARPVPGCLSRCRLGHPARPTLTPAGGLCPLPGCLLVAPRTCCGASRSPGSCAHHSAWHRPRSVRAEEGSPPRFTTGSTLHQDGGQGACCTLPPSTHTGRRPAHPGRRSSAPSCALRACPLPSAQGPLVTSAVAPGWGAV